VHPILGHDQPADAERPGRAAPTLKRAQRGRPRAARGSQHNKRGASAQAVVIDDLDLYTGYRDVPMSDARRLRDPHQLRLCIMLSGKNDGRVHGALPAHTQSMWPAPQSQTGQSR
jgi:hypothetical protein